MNERNFGSGLFSRLGCLPVGTDYFECAEFRVMTKAEENRNQTLKDWAYRLDKVQGELPMKALNKACFKYVHEIKTLAKIDHNKTEAFLVNRVPYYGINVAMPYILMRHYDEWCEKRTFTCDKYDIELCQLIMEIQMHSQRQFFGKYAEMYFDNRLKDQSAKEYVERTNRSDDILNRLPSEFTLEDIKKIHDLPEDSVRVMISRWVKKGKVEKMSYKKSVNQWKKKS